MKFDDAPSEVAVGDRIYWINGRYSIIFDIKDEIKKDEIEMTREEALKALLDVDHRNKPINKNGNNYLYKDEYNYVLIEKLKALGLIKFEEKSMYNVVVDEKAAEDFKLKGYFVEIRK